MRKAESKRCVRCKRRKATAMKEVFWVAGKEYVEIPVCDECGRK